MTSSLYLSPSLYKQHGHILSPFQEYWFNQAAFFEPIAMKVLQEKYSEISLCKPGATDQRVIKLIPNLFYNPQMRVLHGKVVANVYSGGGTLLGAYLGETQQPANINHGIESSIQKTYLAAMQDLTSKLSLSPQAYEVASEVKLPCNLVGAQEEPKFGFY